MPTTPFLIDMGLAVLNSELSNLVHQFLSVTLRNFTQGIFSNFLLYQYWQRLENQGISLVKTIKDLPKATDYLLS